MRALWAISAFSISENLFFEQSNDDDDDIDIDIDLDFSAADARFCARRFFLLVCRCAGMQGSQTEDKEISTNKHEHGQSGLERTLVASQVA